MVLLDLLEAQVGLVGLVDLDLKVSQGSLAEMVHQVSLVSKEREVILVCRDYRDQVCHPQSQKERREILVNQGHLASQVQRELLVSLVTLESPVQMDVLDFLGPQGQRESQATLEAQVDLEDLDLKAAWEKWDYQDQQV